MKWTTYVCVCVCVCVCISTSYLHPDSSPVGHHRVGSWAPALFGSFPLAIYFIMVVYICQSHFPN